MDTVNPPANGMPVPKINIRTMVRERIAELQAGRKSEAKARISASPDSIMNAVKSGKLSLDELKRAIASLE